MSLFKSFCGFLTTIYIAQPHQGDSFPVRLFDLMHLAPPLLLAAAPAVYRPTDASWDLNCWHRAGEKTVDTTTQKRWTDVRTRIHTQGWQYNELTTHYNTPHTGNELYKQSITNKRRIFLPSAGCRRREKYWWLCIQAWTKRKIPCRLIHWAAYVQHQYTACCVYNNKRLYFISF